MSLSPPLMYSRCFTKLIFFTAFPSPPHVIHPRFARNRQSERIVGGVEAAVGEFPWQVRDGTSIFPTIIK